MVREEEARMYRINPLKRNVLIMTDEVIFHAPTKQTVDPRMIEQNIIVAEERLIRPALGTEFYFALIDQKNRLVTNTNKEGLQDQINSSLPSGSQAVTLTVGDVVNSQEFLIAENKVLWNQILWKLTAESVMLLALPEGFVQYGSTGAVFNQPPAGPMSASNSIVTPDLRSMKWAADKKMSDRIDPLRESMHMWICLQKADKSKGLYGLYQKPCDCDENGIAYKRKSDWVTGVYDDHDDDHHHHKKCCP